MIRHEDIDDGPLSSKCHKVCCWPRCCLPCNWLLKPCRHAVSRKKKRYVEDSFDLDLVYLTPRIIVHGFPATGVEHIYRNPRLEIKRFLDERHRDHYMLFNFCCEPGRGYDPEVFHGRVQRYPFKDHCTPPLETMAAFANSAKLWLEEDDANVCSMHCKAGKGRAGLMSCVLLVRSGTCPSAAAAMDKYDKDRTHNNRGLTVTSQRKFVLFYEMLWRQHWGVSGDIGEIDAVKEGEKKFAVPPQPEKRLSSITLTGSRVGTLPQLKVKIYQGTNFDPILLWSGECASGDNQKAWAVDCVIKGNFCVRFETIPLMGKGKKKMEMWHNTLFMERGSDCVDFGIDQIDIKRKLLAELGNDLLLQLNFSGDRASNNGSKDIELTVAAANSDRPAVATL